MSHSKEELEIYTRFNEFKIFKKSLEHNINLPEYKYLDGPPFATGLPHYGHLLAGYIKDSMTRYHHNKGSNVSRRAGWDCHGLPIEYEIEKKHKISNKDQIEEMGIDVYNGLCKDIVLEYTSEWEDIMLRCGRWIDFDNAYHTMDLSYMNSVWWVFSQLYKGGRAYEGVKVMGYSTRCATPLSNFEVNQNYQDVKDNTLYVKFKINNFHDKELGLELDVETYALVWTTTPWTLPSNYALCVNSKIKYSLINSKDKNYIIASDLILECFKENEYTLIKEYDGKELVGLEYECLFNYNDKVNKYKIIDGEFVTNKSGTGIVHIAPAFGEDDYNICIKHNIINKMSKLFIPIDDNGNVDNLIPEMQSKPFKTMEKSSDVNKDLNTWVIVKLKEKDLLFKQKQIDHSYPFCWRSNTPLIYKAVNSWFIKVDDIRQDLCENNSKINWNPSSIGKNKFHNWLSGAIDWGISRSRYWGTPIPIWKSNDGDIICVESSLELERLLNLEENTLKDIHREFIDNLIIKKDGKEYKRISDTFDCWFESGCSPYATCGENNEGIVKMLNNGYELINDNETLYIKKENHVSKILPADFIAEGVDQTRGWFYTLLVLSTSLFNMIPFKNVIVNGIILAADGKKMSKNLKNYPEINTIIEKYGSDATRLYLLSSPAVNAESFKFDENGVYNIVKDILIPLNSAVSFLTEYLNLYMNSNNYNPIDLKSDIQEPINLWMINKYNEIYNEMKFNMDNYNLSSACKTLYNLVEILNNGYIKIGRNYLKGKEGNNLWKESLNVLFRIIYLISINYRHLIPFQSEIIYDKIKEYLDETTTVESVHLISHSYEKILNVNIAKYNNEIKINEFETVYSLITSINQIKSKNNINLKKPVNKITVLDASQNIVNNNMQKLIKDITNVLILEFKNISEYNITKTIVPIKAFIFKKYGKNITETFNKLMKMSLEELEYVINSRTLDNFEFDESLFNINYKLDIENYKLLCSSHYLNGNNILIITDIQENELVNKMYYFKQVASSIQKARKNGGLHPWDKIKVYISGNPKYEFDCDAINYIKDIIRVDVEYCYDNRIISNLIHSEFIEEIGIKIEITNFEQDDENLAYYV